MRKTNKRGFTIVELVIVIAVIAILAAVLIPTFSNLVKKANESSDIQAARNMNTFLAAAKITGEVNSILDVYDIFEDSGYSVESYKPLYADRHYYYDSEYNQILYVDGNNKVLFPTEYKGETQKDGHNWFSLSMTVSKATRPTVYVEPTSSNGKTITATVNNAEEYAYVIEQYNKAENGTCLALTLNSSIDLRGANCLIKEAKGNITIQSTVENNPVVIKNVVSNVELAEGAFNAQKVEAAYYAGGLIAKVVNKEITIQNVIVENVHVKVPTAGGVGILIGSVQGNSSITMNNVTIKNCSVIGHRDVGALAGNVTGGQLTLSGKIQLDNVQVKTTGGRAALLVGKLVGDSTAVKAQGATIEKNNATLSIYEDPDLQQKFATGSAIPGGLTIVQYTYTENGAQKYGAKNGDDKKLDIFAIRGQDQYIYSLKSAKDEAYSLYGFKADALILVQTGEAATTEAKAQATSTYGWIAITSMGDVTKDFTVGVIKTSNP